MFSMVVFTVAFDPPTTPAEHIIELFAFATHNPARDLFGVGVLPSMRFI